MTGMNDEGRQWYVVNTYSGHENKVKENLEKRVESMGLQDVLFQIVIPEHVETEIKAVPYCIWNNRGKGEMLVWMREEI